MSDNNKTSKQIEVFGKTIRVDAGYTIPIKAESIAALEQALSKEAFECSEVAAIVAEDVGLAAIVLKIINAPEFGLQRSVTDIQQSVMLLGRDFFIQLLQLDFFRRAVPPEYAINLGRFGIPQSGSPI